LEETSLGGASYALVLLDDATRYTDVRCLEAKSEAAIALLEMITVKEVRQERQLKTLRTDEGKEFDNESLNSELKRKGVEHQMTTRYYPQSNGRTERVNRTLLECVRSMLAAAKCPKIFWDEAIRTACTVRNVASCGAGCAKTPHELFWGRERDISMLRVWGCTAFAHEHSEIRKKLDPKSTKGILVGYSRNKKAWRSLVEPDYGEHYIVESRDCVFNVGETETISLCKDQVVEDFASWLLDDPECSTSARREVQNSTAHTAIPGSSNPRNEEDDRHSHEESDDRTENNAQAVQDDAQPGSATPEPVDTGDATQGLTVDEEVRVGSGSQIN
jgi:hypothetical protein